MYEYPKYILDLDTSQHLARLEKMYFHYDGQHSLYSSVYYKFRASLTLLFLVHDDDSIFSSQYGGILNYLSPFKKLTRLHYWDKGAHEISIYQIHAICPGLTSLSFSTKFPLPLRKIDDPNFEQNSKLKELSVSCTVIYDDYIGYLAEYLPQSVEKLDLTITTLSLYQWMVGIVGIDTMLQLAKRMNNLRSVSLREFPIEEEDEEDFEGVHESENGQENLTVLFKILNAIKGDKETFCSVILSGLSRTKNSIVFTGQDLRIKHKFSYDDIYDRFNCELENYLPDRTDSVIGLEIINDLTFLMDVEDPEFPFQILKYSLSNCPYLRLIEFKGSSGFFPEFTLNMRLEKSYEEVRNNDLSTISKETLKAATLKNFIPSQEFLDLLNYYLPDIYGIACESAKFPIYTNQGTGDLIVDLTHFKSLKMFYFDVQLILNVINLDHFFIKFEFVDEKNFYYHFANEDAKFKPISVKKARAKRKTPVKTIIFKCEKIENFTLYSLIRRNILEIFKGAPQNMRRFSLDDLEYIDFLTMEEFNTLFRSRK